MYLKSLCLGVIYSYYLYICRMSVSTMELPLNLMIKIWGCNSTLPVWRIPQVALPDHVWLVLQFKQLQLEMCQSISSGIGTYWYLLFRNFLDKPEIFFNAQIILWLHKVFFLEQKFLSITNFASFPPPS